MIVEEQDVAALHVVERDQRGTEQQEQSGKGQRHKSSGVLWLVQLPEKVVGE